MDLPSIIMSPVSNWKERKQRRWKEGEEGEDVCRGRRGFSNFKSEHVNLLKKMTYPEEKRTRIWSYNSGTVADWF